MVSRYHCAHLQESSASIHSPGHSSLPPNRGRSGCALMSCRNWLFCSSVFLLSNDKEECIMSMIRVENLTFSYPSSYDTIFDGVSFQIDTDWKLGLIGAMAGEKPPCCACSRARRNTRGGSRPPYSSITSPIRSGWRRPTAERGGLRPGHPGGAAGGTLCWTGATVRANPACCGC